MCKAGFCKNSSVNTQASIQSRLYDSWREIWSVPTLEHCYVRRNAFQLTFTFSRFFNSLHSVGWKGTKGMDTRLSIHFNTSFFFFWKAPFKPDHSGSRVHGSSVSMRTYIITSSSSSDNFSHVHDVNILKNRWFIFCISILSIQLSHHRYNIHVEPVNLMIGCLILFLTRVYTCTYVHFHYMLT